MATRVTIRVRTAARMARVELEPTATIAMLKAELAKDIGVGPVSQRLTTTAAGGAPLPDGATLASLGLGNGALLHCAVPAGVGIAPAPPGSASLVAVAASSSAAPPAVTIAKGGLVRAAAPALAAEGAPRALTPNCRHAAGGACHFCLPAVDADFERKAAESLNKAGRYAPRHMERSAAPSMPGAAGAPAADGDSDMPWLCRHRPDAMCVNCAPIHKGDKVPLEMLCLHGPEARCTNCLPPDSTVSDRKFIAYDEWRERRRAKCEHSFNAICVNCTPPDQVSYRLKQQCGRHAPWPRGICLDCTPPPVDLRLQAYRHVDFIEVANYAEMAALVQLWDANRAAGVQRAAVMYGRARADANYRLGTKVVVEGLYEPPQAYDATTGAVRLLSDPKERAVAAVTEALGLQPVGLLLTRRRNADASAPALLPHELFAMAALQLAHPAPAGKPGSRFVTLVVSRVGAGAGEILPRGFMASDQLMALVRDGVLVPPGPADLVFSVRKQGPGEPPVPEVIKRSAARGAFKSSSFEPEFVTVTLEAGSGAAPAAGGGAPAGSAPPKEPGPLFRHASFPVENRSDFGVRQSGADLRAHLLRYRPEPYHERLGDFHALIFLATHLDADTAAAIAKAVARGEPLGEGLDLLVSSIERQ